MARVEGNDVHSSLVKLRCEFNWNCDSLKLSMAVFQGHLVPDDKTSFLVNQVFFLFLVFSRLP